MGEGRESGIAVSLFTVKIWKLRKMTVYPDGDIDISKCTELQSVLWSVSPKMRCKMDAKSIYAYYESEAKHIDVSQMSVEEREIFDHVVAKYGPLLP